MKSLLSWDDKVFKDNAKADPCIWDLCFSPDGVQMILAAGNRVLVYDVANGTQIHALKGHKDTVLCCAYAKDGKNFATGSADKSVIIWTNKFEGLLKYAHDDAIMCLSFNPMTHVLLSCAMSDIGLWSQEQKKVVKVKVSARVTSCSWTNDGQYLALGLFTGVISIRNKVGEERVTIDKTANGPIWSLEWCPNREENIDMLAVADWSQKLSFYHLSGKPIGKEKHLGYDPCSLNWFNKGEYLIISGSNKQCNLYSKDGHFLSKIAEQNSWIWCAKMKPDLNCAAIGCQDGWVGCYQIAFSTIHSFFKDRYAYRENMTDVIVQHLVTDQKVRIKCRELVKKVAVYKNKLAVQMSDKFVIYEAPSEEPNSLQYKLLAKFNKKVDCHLVVICGMHIILCLEKHLQCLTFEGVKEREWILESQIRYLKVTGGAKGREGLLVGLKSGLIFIDNPFPIQLLKVNSSMRCIDLNSNRSKLAIVDDHNTCLVYSVKSKELLYQEPNANSVAWNVQHDDMVGFSGNGFLNVKSANFPVHQQKQQGFVVGFDGSKIYCLNNNTITSVDIPQSAAMYQYLEKKMYQDSYTVACLGVSASDWDALGTESLEAMEVSTARKAFSRTRDIHCLDLIYDIEERMRRGETNKQLFLGDIYALQGKYAEAAKVYKKSGYTSYAMNMYTDLRMFDLAKEYLGSDDPSDKKMFMTKQADWASNLNEPKSAAEMYITAGEFVKAIEIIGEHGWADMLIDLARKLDKADREALSRSAFYLQKMEQYAYASEVYSKMGDIKSLASLLVEAKLWEEAFSLVKKHPEYKADVYLPYAQWLAENDKFEEAQQAFHKAGLQQQAVKVLEQLTHNAVVENRFNDAGYYYWKLSMQFLDLAAVDESHRIELLGRFDDFQRKAEIYYAYHSIQRYMEEPFTSHQPEALFNIARFLLHCLMTEVPVGVSKVYTLYSLAKQSKNLGAMKMARYAFEKLQSLQVPFRFQEAVDLGSITIRSKPFHDAEDLLLMCYRCSSTNPLMNNQGNVCINCRQPFVFSFVSFEVLPLVEFILDPDISDSEAVSLLELEPPPKKSESWKGSKTSSEYNLVAVCDWMKNISCIDVPNNEFYYVAGGQSLKIDDYSTMDEEDSDAFLSKFTSFEEGGSEYQPVVANRNVLRSLSRTEVIICEWPSPKGNQYFKVVMLDVPLTKCNSCNKIFHKDDYELLALQEDRCPFCRKSIDE